MALNRFSNIHNQKLEPYITNSSQILEQMADGNQGMLVIFDKNLTENSSYESNLSLYVNNEFVASGYGFTDINRLIDATYITNSYSYVFTYMSDNFSYIKDQIDHINIFNSISKSPSAYSFAFDNHISYYLDIDKLNDTVEFSIKNYSSTYITKIEYDLLITNETIHNDVPLYEAPAIVKSLSYEIYVGDDYNEESKYTLDCGINNLKYELPNLYQNTVNKGSIDINKTIFNIEDQPKTIQIETSLYNNSKIVSSYINSLNLLPIYSYCIKMDETMQIKNDFTTLFQKYYDIFNSGNKHKYNNEEILNISIDHNSILSYEFFIFPSSLNVSFLYNDINIRMNTVNFTDTSNNVNYKIYQTPYRYNGIVNWQIHIN